MKFSTLSLLLVYLLKQTVTQEVNECILGVRVYPFKYIGATQTVEFRLAFKSNCLDFASLNFFILPYNKNFKLTQNSHPKTVVLSLFGKAYQFNFSAPKRKGFHKFMNIHYSKVRMLPSKVPKAFNTLNENNILLRTTRSNSFTKNELDTLYYKKNPCLCKLNKTKRTMLCKL